MSSHFKICCYEPKLAAALKRQTALEVPLAPSDVVPPGVEIVFGQPSADVIVRAAHVRWVHLSAAGYTTFDDAAVRATLVERGTMVTTSSAVYADPCAQHVLGMMLGFNRQLLRAHDNHRTTRGWPMWPLREQAATLAGQTVLLLGFGAIGQRLAELLRPFQVKLVAVRRAPARAGEGIEIIPAGELARVLPRADHVVDLLPLNAESRGLMNRERFALLKPGAVFYNIGRGATVDQDALVAALQSGRFHAHLDVTAVEPLAPEHPLWALPNCVVTPHIAGGRRDEAEALTWHFLENLRRFSAGTPLLNRVI